MTPAIALPGSVSRFQTRPDHSTLFTWRVVTSSIVAPSGNQLSKNCFIGPRYIAARTADLVVTDLQMPRVDGLELTRRLKAADRFRNVPVIVVSTRSTETDRKRGLEAGADAYFVKSALNQAELVECARRLTG